MWFKRAGQLGVFVVAFMVAFIAVFCRAVFELAWACAARLVLRHRAKSSPLLMALKCLRVGMGFGCCVLLCA